MRGFSPWLGKHMDVIWITRDRCSYRRAHECSFFLEEKFYEISLEFDVDATRVHPDRAAGRYRHHRSVDRTAAAGRAVGARSRTSRPVHQQPEADRPGLIQLREWQYLLPTLGRIHQLRGSKPGFEYLRHDPVRRRCLGLSGSYLALHGGKYVVQCSELQRGLQRSYGHELHRLFDRGRDLSLSFFRYASAVGR